MLTLPKDDLKIFYANTLDVPSDVYIIISYLFGFESQGLPLLELLAMSSLGFHPQSFSEAHFLLHPHQGS